MCPNNSGNPRSTPSKAPPAAAELPPYPPQPIPNFAPTAPVVSKPSDWSTGLCSCCEDISSCITTCCCPCITFGQNAEIIDRGTTSCVGAGLVYYLLAHACCSCLYTCTYRKKLRSLFGLKEEPCADFFVHCCCHFCAICQEYRELQSQGFDPSVGWLANVDRWNRGGAMGPPTFATGMAR
ncbi:PLAC8 motif-containing protein - like 10 [Theobroma cacao]|nr:PLAC8 motif-containing protein - like 10 [Theobroma cacao]